MQNNIEKSWKMSKMDPKMGAQTWSFFGHLAPFFCARQPWEPKWLPSLPQEPPRPVQTSISIDFGWFFDDFLYHVGYFLSGLPHYFFGYLELSFSNFWPQVQMCWGRPQGSVRSQKKNAMWPTFCLACFFVFVTSSRTFQVSGHRLNTCMNAEMNHSIHWMDCVHGEIILRWICETQYQKKIKRLLLWNTLLRIADRSLNVVPKTSKASLRKRFSRHGGGPAGGNWDKWDVFAYWGTYECWRHGCHDSGLLRCQTALLEPRVLEGVRSWKWKA